MVRYCVVAVAASGLMSNVLATFGFRRGRLGEIVRCIESEGRSFMTQELVQCDHCKGHT
jgi:hypothetical protein